MGGTRHVKRLAGALVVLALPAGCSDGGTDEAPKTSIETTAVAPTELVTGDCLVGIVIGRRQQIEIESVSVVDCSGRHDLEVFNQFELTPEMVRSEDMNVYPGRGRVETAASIGCNDALAATGIDTDLLGAISLWPSDKSWAEGDRTVACAIYLQDGRDFDGRQLELQPQQD